jgi:hypothetical protein
MANTFESALLLLVTAALAVVIIALVKRDLDETRRKRSSAISSDRPMPRR